MKDVKEWFRTTIKQNRKINGKKGLNKKSYGIKNKRR